MEKITAQRRCFGVFFKLNKKIAINAQNIQ